MPDELLPSEHIRNRIHLIRGQQVILDSDLAELYRVETFRLNERVKRNKKKFPDDFMFQLNQEEFENLTSQIAISSWGGLRRAPYAFTEQGIAMLSGVLNSERAIDINIQIMREFVAMRHYLIDKNELENAFIEKYDKSFKEVLAAFYQLLETKSPLISVGGNLTNSTITIGGSTKWDDEAYKLIQKILADLDEVKLPAKAEKVIQENSKSLVGLLEEGRPARRRLKECLATIKTTLEMAAISSSIVNGIMERIQQIMKLLG